MREVFQNILHLQVREENFPLFVTEWDWLCMLDLTVSTAESPPFLLRNLDGSVFSARGSSIESEITGLMIDGDGQRIELNLSDSEEDSDEEDAHSIAETNQPAPSPIGQQRRECTYQVFEAELWTKITSAKHRSVLKPSLVWQEIVSHIKGSAEALQSAYLREETEAMGLTREEYLTSEDRIN